jgi:2-succinyl-5-enolpyruvyl-6-hydroxy-3-cyclohexene-1-carboxylate synthase/pimeloyl-ACP methyl ester carboxylesterase/L-alanine-DL-glutamate epimerase-like enolase superfamily enzyme
MGGRPWTTNSLSLTSPNHRDVQQVVDFILKSKRGIIVVGNTRKTTENGTDGDSSHVNQLISNFAQTIGFPIFASSLAADLRFQSPAVVLYAEHILRCPLVHNNLKPDLILQFGAPLISTELPNIVKSTIKQGPTNHILIHPRHPSERTDPEFTVSQAISADIGSFIRDITTELDRRPLYFAGSELAPMVVLGRLLQREMPRIVDEATSSRVVKDDPPNMLTEPQVMLEMSKIFNSEVAPKLSLFISNSMPVRDAEAFLYPLSGGVDRSSLSDVGVNRGASGIDGVIASAAGFADSTGIPTTLIIGDVAALHDINSLHSLKTAMSAKEAQAQKIHPLTTIVLNNNGGGIFSFLPIAKHGNDVSFDEFFGTPTNTFSFQKGVEAFDIPFKRVHNTSSLADAYIESIKCTEPTIIEALVATREENVKIHQTISSATSEFIVTSLESAAVDKTDAEMLPVTISSIDGSSSDACNHPAKTMVLLHGWMGDRDEWSEVVERLTQTLPSGWNILTFDLPGHGKARHLVSSKMQLIRRALHVGDEDDAKDLEQFSLDALARSVCATLNQMNITSVDALGGYSLGGRVALAMKRLSMTPSTSTTNMPGLINDATRMILVSCNVGVFGSTNQREAQLSSENIDRLKKDEELYTQMQLLVARGMLSDAKPQTETMIWSDFLRNWYSASLWGSVSGNEQVYPKMLERRMASLAYRGLDHAKVLRQCSPPRCSAEDWRGVKAQDTLLLVGSMDNTYCKMGRQWADLEPSLGYVEIPERGHALLVEDPVSVADEIANFIVKHRIESDKDTEKKIWNTTFIPSPSKNREGRSTLSRQDLQFVSSIASLDFEGFSVDLVDKRSKQKSVSGIGWGETARVDSSTSTTSRQGVILQVVSRDGLFVGLGEVSPLQGLHPESLAEAEMQLETIATVLSKTDPSDLPSFDAKSILGLDGALHSYISSLLFALVCDSTVYRSVWAGLEMAILSIASQVVRLPMHEAILANAPSQYETTCRLSMLPLNGLIRRSSDENQPIRIDFDPSETAYPSWKIKVGHQTLENDVKSIKMTVSQIPDTIKIRADANRGFSDDQFRKLASDLAAERDLTSEKIEYIEEPLSKQQSEGFPWTLEAQVNVLEMLYNDAGIPYALDESMYDLLLNHGSDCEKVLSDLRNVFARGSRGCAAFVLKPSLLGLEVSMRIARLARSELGIGAVFTSSFDTGIGLAYASFLASLSDATKSKPGALLYAHGLSTFELMHPDCLSPSFGSYVSNTGIVNVASISRALYGLGIDELQSLSLSASPPALPLLDDSVGQSIEDVDFSISVLHPAGRRDDDADKTQTSLDIESSGFMSDEFVASTSSSRNGRDIVVVASLPLPFSPIIGASRFTDLPQQPRWSPWLASVAYLDAPGSETEWTLRVRGVSFRWRARSEILQKPYRGIRWKSTSGVKNTGAVEFVPAPGDPNKCYMKVRMAFVTPRLMSSLFRGTVLEDFLRNKILKWSLESFRDVVLGDLALEEGNVELGDALFGAVEGKTSAIEEAFLPVPSLDKDTT